MEKPNKEYTARKNYFLPISMIEWLHDESVKRNISEAQLVRDLIDAEMKRTEEPDKKTRTP